jgi:hypothetical protein
MNGPRETEEEKRQRMLDGLAHAMAVRDITADGFAAIAAAAAFMGAIVVFTSLGKWSTRIGAGLAGLFYFSEPARAFILTLLGIE